MPNYIRLAIFGLLFFVIAVSLLIQHRDALGILAIFASTVISMVSVSQSRRAIDKTQQVQEEEQS